MDYALAIVEFFVERRGKGSAVSSADEQLVLNWEEEGIPLPVVFAGVDSAFDRKAEPPKSLSECGRWVRSAFKKWGEGGDRLGAAHDGVLRATPDGERAPEVGERQTLRAESGEPSAQAAFVGRLREREALGHVALREAVREIREEVEGLKDVTPELADLIELGIAEAALERLDAAERRRVVAEAEAPLRGSKRSPAAFAAARAAEVVRVLEAAT